MCAVVFRHLFFALSMAALILAGMTAEGAPMAVAATGVSGMCAHCRADPAASHLPAKMPPCAVASCSAAVIVAPVPAQAAMLSWSRAEYFPGPAPKLSGAAPKTDPPPPRSLLVF